MIHRLYMRLATLTALAALAAVVPAVAAQAAVPTARATLLTNISVTVTTNMCPQGGSVSKANVAIDTPGTSGVSSGDTVGGLKAWVGNNAVHGSNFCRTTWYGGGYYWYWSVTRYFSFNGQHTYV
ncbi:hypothetical protein SAMN05421812_10680 [Asanoa hainanensis]|uniref:Uncharacterized protein n=1 Tax=Asanoa hainanensis TaxID=560556 RepID=A0A239MPX4_9ACTN|nr:hypothetical protein [Asanoa hainanensis]SNT44152.1 hypothetical protein SAMN05421812_10680 [Asanoa hainanensis]